MTGLCFVSCTRGNHFMTEVLAGVARVLADKGARVELVFDRFPRFDEATAYVVIPHEFFTVVDPADWPDEDQLAATISFCVEMPGTEWFDVTAQHARRTARSVCINRSGTGELIRRGVPTEHFQLGYSPAWDRWGRDDARQRPVDVLYLGSTDERRDRYLAGYAGVLWRHRTRILVPPIDPRFERRPDSLMGDEKLDLIASSKILINLHRGESRSFEWVRVLESVCNGCVVVSEHSVDHHPLQPGEHFVSAAPELLGAVADALLADPGGLAVRRLAAYDFARSELRMDVAAERLLAMAEASVASPAASARGTAFVRPAVPDAAPVSAPLPDRLEAELFRLRAGLHRVAVESLETRRIVQDLLTRDGEWDVDGAREVTRTAAMATPTPRVSVLVPLYNHAVEVVEVLDSMAASEGVDYELLVYDDASTDGSLDTVVGFLSGHDWMAAAVLQGRANRGPSRARNVLARRSRGDLLFFLDSDNKVFPTTLMRLVEVLDERPDASFAYSMLAAYTAGIPVGLMSARPWDPKSLRNGNFIDTMALVRRDAFLAVGGFCEDVRLTGCEDYDLWCRFAQSGRLGVLLPEVLGWYRRTRHSRNALQLDATAVMSFIRERSPAVFA